MANIYKKIVEPILGIDSDRLRRAAWILENHKPADDDNLERDARWAAAEVLNRVARLEDFADWIFSDAIVEEMDVQVNE